MKTYLENLLYDLAETDSSVALLTLLLVVTVIVLDGVMMAIRHNKKETGLDSPKDKDILNCFETIPVKTYVSETQGLSGRPDALLIENGYVIPVERKPLARKIRDRYVAQLLVYLRLVEEFEGKRPPYGYLILGANARKVKIENSAARQEWLQKHIDEMKLIAAEKQTALPSPHPQKCKKCPVRMHCSAASETLIRPSEKRQLCAIGNES